MPLVTLLSALPMVKQIEIYQLKLYLLWQNQVMTPLFYNWTRIKCTIESTVLGRLGNRYSKYLEAHAIQRVTETHPHSLDEKSTQFQVSTRIRRVHIALASRTRRLKWKQINQENISTRGLPSCRLAHLVCMLTPTRVDWSFPFFSFFAWP